MFLFFIKFIGEGIKQKEHTHAYFNLVYPLNHPQTKIHLYNMHSLFSGNLDTEF